MTKGKLDSPSENINAKSENLKQLHVNIPSNLHKRFRVKVLEEGRSMGQVIEDLIENYISQNSNSSSQTNSDENENKDNARFQ